MGMLRVQKRSVSTKGKGGKGRKTTNVPLPDLLRVLPPPDRDVRPEVIPYSELLDTGNECLQPSMLDACKTIQPFSFLSALFRLAGRPLTMRRRSLDVEVLRFFVGGVSEAVEGGLVRGKVGSERAKRAREKGGSVRRCHLCSL